MLVGRQPYLAGGRVSADGAVAGGSAYARASWLLGPWLGPDVFWPMPPLRNWPPSPGWATKPWRDIEGVAEYIDGCAPAAATRSIKAVMGAAGIKTEPAASMYSDLIETMETGIAMGGTEDADMLVGKEGYCDGHGLPLDSGLSYGPPSLQAAQDALVAGGDVEVLIAWNPNGGHVAMVTGMIQWPDGSWTITYVDDPDQSDGRAENEEHVIQVDPGGGFDGGHVDGFMLETKAP
jgi:hypothetical protein